MSGFAKTAVVAVLLCLALPAPVSGQNCGCVARHPVEIGVNVHNPPEENYTLAAAANMRWVRSAIRWEEVEPSQGNWTWDFVDVKVREANERGLKLLMILHCPPPWSNGYRKNNVPSPNRALWAEYVRQVSARYNGTLDPMLKVHAYEIWNEPDIPDGGDGVGWNQHTATAPTYADYVYEAGVQIRANDPSAIIVAGSYSSIDSHRLRMSDIAFGIQHSVYPGGRLENYIDVLSFHANASGSEYSDNVTDRAKFRISEHASQNPATACKPKWITEFGSYWTSDVTEWSQMERLRRMTEMFAGTHYSSNCTGWTRGTHNVQLAFIYFNKDYDATPIDGIHRGDGSPKPAVTHWLRLLPYPANDW